MAHGANDVANAVAPLASVWMVYSTGTVASKAEVPIWILIYGGVALDIGVITMVPKPCPSTLSATRVYEPQIRARLGTKP